MTTDQMTPTIPHRFACPDWCISGLSGHQQALDEGCTWEEARVHRSGDHVGHLSTLTNPYSGRLERQSLVGWQVVTVADPGAGQWFGHPFIELELHEYDEATRKRVMAPMTSGEARVLAAQLLRLADGIDLQG